MKASPILAIVLALISFSLPACNMHKEEQSHQEHNKLVVTSPKAKDVVITQQYVCQIHSKRHIKIRALQSGYLEPIEIKEGQAVEKDEVMFEVVPTLYQAKLEAEVAEVKLAQLELNNTKKLAEDNAKVVSQNEVLLYEAKLAKAQAKEKLARAELKFTKVTAPFAGIVDRLLEQHGSLVKERDVLTTLSDNSVMWVYFNVPEVRYLEYMRGPVQDPRQIELVLANGRKFEQPAKSVRIEAQFNNETGNIPFRADFLNPDRLLRHGQTGNVLIHRTLKNAIVIPQRATFEILDRRYVYVVDKEDVVHQRQIVVQNEMDDVFVIKKGLGVNDKIVLEGVRQVHEGDTIEYEFRTPEEALSRKKQKFHSE